MASFQTRRRQLSRLMWPPAGAGKIKRAPSSGRASERKAARAGSWKRDDAEGGVCLAFSCPKLALDPNLVHRGGAGSEVDIGPRKGCPFFRSEPCGARKADERAIVAGAFCDCFDLSPRSEGANVRGGLSWPTHGGRTCWVPSQVVPLDGLIEDLTKRIENMPSGFGQAARRSCSRCSGAAVAR